MENMLSYHTTSKGERKVAAIGVFLLATLVLSTIAIIVPVVSATTYYPETIQAGGSTFVNPVMQVWAAEENVQSAGAVTVNYQAIGSGAGINGIFANTFGFAGSDAPIGPKTSGYNASVASYGPILQIPESLGGVAIFYNIPGVTVSLNMTGSVLARIYIGNITMWNDAAIQSLNPHVSLPAATIIPVHRSDGSGTTYALTHYLSQVSADWNASWTNGVISHAGCPCFSTSINWPSFEIGAKGSGGVAAYVQGNTNAIGYADSYYAFSNGLKAAAIQNMAGKFLIPTLTDISNAASDFAVQIQNNPTFTITNAPGSNSYPISTFTYVFVWQDQNNVTSDAHKGYDIAYFLLYIVTKGQAFGPPLNYPKLPSNVVVIDESIIQKLQFNGVPYITLTSVGVTCSVSPVTVGMSTLCKATVGGLSTHGKVTFGSNGLGRFVPATATCVVNPLTHSCSVRYYPTLVQPLVNVSASYLSNDGSTIGTGNFGLSVAQRASHALLVCVPLYQLGGHNITCTATVTGFQPTGTVTFSQIGGTGTVSFFSTTCSLTHVGTTWTLAKCSVKLKGTALGTANVDASYGGDVNNIGSISVARILHIH